MLYCAYGSNLHPGRLEERIGSARQVGTTSLRGWMLRFHKRSNIDGSGKCDIVPSNKGCVVNVAVYSLEATDLAMLDRIEGLGNGYTHQKLELHGYGDALAYVAEPSHIDSRLLPYSWYKEYVLAGCRYQGFQAEYIDALMQLPHREDPDRGRHDEHMERIAGLARWQG